MCLLAIQGNAGWEALQAWQWRNPQPQGNGLNALTQGNGRYIAVGSNGTTIASLNGSPWSVSPLGNNIQLNGVAYGTNLFVAVGKAGIIFTTQTGSNWTARNSGTTNDLNSVTSGSNMFVAVGERGTILISSDGAQWIPQNVNSLFSLKACTFGSNTFVVVGSSPSGGLCGPQGTRLTSTNGVDWQIQQSFDEKSIVDVRWTGTQFVAVGISCGGRPVYSKSVDGNDWTKRTVPSGTEPRSIAAGISNIVIATISGFQTSADTTNWTSVSIGTNSSAVIAVGHYFTCVTRNGDIYASTNGLQWGDQLSGSRFSFSQIATQTNGGRLMVAIDARIEAGSRIATSTNGVDWSEQLIIGYKLTDMIYTNGKFHIIGTQVGGPNTLFSSSDGFGFGTTAIYTIPFAANGIVRGNNLFVIVTDNGGIMTSSDLVQWTIRNSGTGGNLADVVYGNGVFLCRDTDGGLRRSANGIDWSPCPTPVGQTYSGIVAGSGILLAFNSTSGYAASPDGLTWTSGNIGTNLFGATTFANGSFVSVTPEAVLTSPDAVNWTRRQSNLPFDKTPFPNGPVITFGTKNLVLNRHRFTLLGPAGAILQSGDIGASKLSAKGVPSAIQITLEGEMSRTYAIQQSGNLASWTLLTTITNSSNQTTFQDTNAVDTSARRFYRSITSD